MHKAKHSLWFMGALLFAPLPALAAPASAAASGAASPAAAPAEPGTATAAPNEASADAAATATPADAQDSSSAPEDPRYQKAKVNFERGVTLFEAGNYNAALVEFQTAYDSLEGHPKRFFVLDNIGQCHERLFRYDLALSFYRRYLEEGGPDAEDRAAVEATMRALEGLLATLKIESNVAAEVWVDDRRMGTAPGTVLIPGGRHVVELRAAGHEPSKREVSVAARETEPLRFSLEHIEEYEGLSPIYFWSGAAATGVAAIGGTYFGIKAKSRHDELADRESSCGSICVLPEDKDEVSDLAVTADVFFLSAAVLGVGTGIVCFMTDFSGKTPKEERTPASGTFTTTRLEPALGVARDGGAVWNLRLRGAF